MCLVLRRVGSSAKTNESCSKTKGSQQEAVPVPSAEEVWIAAWDGFNTLPEKPSPKPRLKPQGDSSVGTLQGFSPFVHGQARLGIQVLVEELLFGICARMQPQWLRHLV